MGKDLLKLRQLKLVLEEKVANLRTLDERNLEKTPDDDIASQHVCGGHSASYPEIGEGAGGD